MTLDLLLANTCMDWAHSLLKVNLLPMKCRKSMLFVTTKATSIQMQMTIFLFGINYTLCYLCPES